MLEALRQPKWWVAGFVVVTLAIIFVRLGIWQLDRLEERKAQNSVGQARIEAEPVPLGQLLDEAGDDLESIRYRPALIAGSWDDSEEVLIRSQVDRGNAGFHVITPLQAEDVGGVLVNRGWVPLTMDSPPVQQASPPPGRDQIAGWVELTRTRPPLGPEDPSGDIDVFNRVDIDRIASQISYPLAPIYLVEMGERDGLPVPVDPPDFEDEGPHLAYAIQWFGFALVGLVGFYFLFRKKGQPRHRDN